MSAVWRAKISPTSLKLTALSLADQCNDDGGSLHPSMQTIAGRVGVSRAQAQRLVHTLVDMGLLSVVANANGGRPGTTPRYQLHLDRLALLQTGNAGETGSAHATGHTDAQEGSHGCTGGVAPMHKTGNTDATQSVRNHQRTVKEPKERRNAPALPRPEGVSEQTWTDWLQLRKSKKAPVTETVITGAHREAEKAGMPLEQFLQVWCMRGSQSLQADWLKPEERRPSGRHTGFASKNYREGVSSDGSFN